MAVNRGKDFEAQVRSAFESVPQTSVIRLLDPQTGYAGVRNICDFVVYHYPHQFFIECKSCYGNTLSFANITENQWTGLLRESNTEGVIAGYLIWFIDHDLTIFIEAKDAEAHRCQNMKSINVKNLDIIPHIEIVGKKRRILFDYDMTEFFKEFEDV